MKKLTEPVYTIILPKFDELASSDPRIKNCLLLIFKKYKKEDYNLKNDVNYIWIENPQWYEDFKYRRFTILQHIDTELLKVYPDLLTHVDQDLFIKSIEDINDLINKGYVIKAYTAPRQYKKDMALYFIENKSLYNKDHISNDEIWNKIMNDEPQEFIKDEIELNVEKKIAEIIGE